MSKVIEILQKRKVSLWFRGIRHSGKWHPATSASCEAMHDLLHDIPIGNDMRPPKRNMKPLMRRVRRQLWPVHPRGPDPTGPSSPPSLTRSRRQQEGWVGEQPAWKQPSPRPACPRG